MENIRFNGEVVVLSPGDSLLLRTHEVEDAKTTREWCCYLSETIAARLPGIPFLIMVGDDVVFSVLRVEDSIPRGR